MYKIQFSVLISISQNTQEAGLVFLCGLMYQIKYRCVVLISCLFVLSLTVSSSVEIGGIATVVLKDLLYLKCPFLPAAGFHLPFLFHHPSSPWSLPSPQGLSRTLYGRVPALETPFCELCFPSLLSHSTGLQLEWPQCSWGHSPEHPLALYWCCCLVVLAVGRDSPAQAVCPQAPSPVTVLPSLLCSSQLPNHPCSFTNIREVRSWCCVSCSCGCQACSNCPCIALLVLTEVRVLHAPFQWLV